MDFDLNTALNDYRVYIQAFESRPAPAASTPPQPELPTVAPGNRQSDGPTTYQDLPPELIWRIGQHVPLEDMGHFSATDRRTYQLMRERRLVWSCWERAKKAVDLKSLKRILWEIGAVLETPQLRVEPMEALRQRLKALPKRQQAAAFKRLFEAADSMPEQGIPIQRALIAMLPDFPGPQRYELYDFMLEMAERRGPERENIWPDLAFGIYMLPTTSPQTLTRYQTLLARLPSLSEAHQSEFITKLCSLLFYFELGPNHTTMDVSPMYSVLRERTLRLPPAYQGAPVGALAAAVNALPEAEKFSRYVEMRDWALSLPDDQWGMALYKLPVGFVGLPSEWHAEEFRVLERALGRVLPAQRMQAAVGLLEGVYKMDDALAKRVWQRALALLDGADEAKLFALLCKLRAVGATIGLGDGQWQLAVEEIQAFMARNQFSQYGYAWLADHASWLRTYRRLSGA